MPNNIFDVIDHMDDEDTKAEVLEENIQVPAEQSEKILDINHSKLKKSHEDASGKG